MVEKLVRLHLLLPEVATRRDLADPVTIRTVCAAVEDAATLDLLYALARADAAATGPAPGRIGRAGWWRTWCAGYGRPSRAYRCRRHRPLTRNWSTGRCPRCN